MLRSPDRIFWLTAALSATAVTAFCFSSWAIAAYWSTAAWHGVALLVYGTFLLRLAPERIGWPTRISLMPVAIAAPYLVVGCSVFPIFCVPFPIAPVLSCSLAMFLFVGLPLNFAYMSVRPGVVAFVTGLGVTPVVYVARWLFPPFFTNLYGDEATLIVSASFLHLGTIAAIAFGHADSLHQKQQRMSSLCRKCGYELAGLVGRVCPECGTRAENLSIDSTDRTATPKV